MFTAGDANLCSEAVEPPYSIVSTFPGYAEDSVCYAALADKVDAEE